MKKAAIGLIGLAVMGENLVMNMESRGYAVSVFNRTADKVSNFVEGRAKGKNILGTYFLEDLVASSNAPEDHDDGPGRQGRGRNDRAPPAPRGKG